MKFSKLPLSFSEQADLLLHRGLIADHNELISVLKQVNYYRLSGYWFPFKNPDNTFKPATTLQKVIERYKYDQSLRLLIFEGVGILEVTLRTQTIYHIAHSCGPFGYTNRDNLPNITKTRFNQLHVSIVEEQKRSKEVFIRHFYTKYGDSHRCLPIWIAGEILTFGMFLTLFRGIPVNIKQQIARQYNISDKVLESWLRALNGVRNTCAHHARLWNRELGYRPMIPRQRKHPEWHIPVEITNHRLFGILSIMLYLLNIIDYHGTWLRKLSQLIKQNPNIPLRPMGFPDNWQESPFWTSI